MLSREDLFRELELLPIWQLRYPATAAASIEAVGDSVEKPVEAGALLQKPLRCILSHDKQWLFLLSSSSDEATEQLLQNILKALDIAVGQDSVATDASHAAQHQPGVIVVMGEAEAQQVLHKQQTIAQLRGGKHTLSQTPVVVTYSVQHLLENVADKAKTWEDLCLAKSIITDL